MDYKEQLISDTRNATNALFNAARAMPEDKLTWKVNDQARSAFDICGECATMTPMTIVMLETGVMPPFDPAMMEHVKAERAKLTLDDCERMARENNEKLFEAIRAFPDEKLQDPIDLPFGDRKWVLADVAAYPLWNSTYHLGQISFIQTLYGDQEIYV